MSGNSPQEGEVPATLDAEALRQQEERATGGEGAPYEAGDTVHGRVDAAKAQQENPWHPSSNNGQKMFSTYDDPLVKITPWHTLSESMQTLLGGDKYWASCTRCSSQAQGVHSTSPYEKFTNRQPNGLAAMLEDLTRAYGSRLSCRRHQKHCERFDRLMERKRRGNPASREELLNAMLHYSFCHSWCGRG